MGIDERQAGQFLLERPQGGQRLVGHFRFARVDAIPCLVRGTGNLSKERFGEILHFLIKAGLGNGFRHGMIHKRRNPIQLPRKAMRERTYSEPTVDSPMMLAHFVCLLIQFSMDWS